MRLRQILNHPIVGNAYHDMPLMEAIDAYVSNKRTPVAGKLQALNKLDDVMGLEHPANAEHALKVYLATRAEDFVDDTNA